MPVALPDATIERPWLQVPKQRRDARRRSSRGCRDACARANSGVWARCGGGRWLKLPRGLTCFRGDLAMTCPHSPHSVRQKFAPVASSDHIPPSPPRPRRRVACLPDHGDLRGQFSGFRNMLMSIHEFSRPVRCCQTLSCECLLFRRCRCSEDAAGSNIARDARVGKAAEWCNSPHRRNLVARNEIDETEP